MKVLIPLHAFLPASRYGAERYTYYLARELQACGIGVHLFFSEPGVESVQQRVYDGLACTVIGRPKVRGPWRLDRPGEAAERGLTRLVREFGPDVVHFNHLLHLSTKLPWLAKDSGCGVVLTLHDYWMRCPKVKLLDWWGQRCVSATAWKCASCCRARFSRMTWPSLKSGEGSQPGALKRLVKAICFQLGERPLAWWRIRRREQEMRRAVKAVDQFIAPTEFLRQRMAEWGVSPAKTVSWDYGTPDIPYVPRSGAGANSRLRFGFLGGATREKGLHVLLEAFRCFAKADLVIYGGGLEGIEWPLADVLRQPNIELGGRIDDAQKAVLLPQLDALVVPSIWYENSPLVIHEAFQAGVPVICSDIGGMAELVTHGEDGLHFRAGDSQDLRRVLHRCVAEPEVLEDLRRRICKPKGMREHVLHEIIPLYESLCWLPRAPGTGGSKRHELSATR
jgi:glycosyltransferase involved in cell wall biosynthesis